MSGAPDPLDTLRALVAEIAVADYRDRLGHRLVNNTAYLEAVAVLEIADTLERGSPARGSGPEGRRPDHEP